MLKIQLYVTGIKYVLKYKTVVLNCNNISQYYYFYCICYQINAASVSIRYFFIKNKNRCSLKFLPKRSKT